MFCPNCGKEMRKGALFCPNCGYKKNSIINSVLSLPKNYVYLAILAIVIVFFFIIFSILNNNHNNSKTELAKAIEKSKIVSDYSDNNTINDMDTVVFGTYVQDSVDIKDKIEWIVLEKNNDKALLMSKNIIDVKPYFSSLGSNVWSNSYLRLWLNGEFYENAFSDEEKKQILKTNVDGNEDSIYILNTDELRLYSGVDLNANYTNYSLNSNNVLMDYSYKIGSKIAPEYTAYSKLYNNQGYSNISYGRTNTSVGTYMYWVRNNINKNEAITANKTMITSNSLDNGYIIQDNGCGVRPVLWVDLTYKSMRDTKDGWDGDYYYVDGEKVINDWVQYKNKWYYLDTDGKYVRGDWKQVGNDWYYFNTDGDMAENTWVNNEYYVDGDGKMLKDTITPDGYYVDGNGKYISNNNSIESLLKLYDKINSETGAFKNVDGSYYTMGVYPSYEKPQLSALFDQYGNLWYLEEEFVGAGKVGTRYYLQIKYLNGSDSEVFTRQFYYDDRDGGSSGYEYDSTQAENMFKQYDNLKDHYTQIKNNVSSAGSNKSVILDADLVKLYNDIKAQIPNGLFENFGSNVIYKGKSLSDYQFGVVHAAEVKFNTDGNLWVYTFYGGIGRDNITIRIFSADGNMKMYYCTTKRDGSEEPFCTTNNSKEITLEEYNRIEQQFDNMIDMYDVYMKNGNVTNASNNNDSLSNQIKRAKLVSEYNSNTTVDQMNTVTFGSYPQNDITGNTKEPIEWIVLDRQGNKALLLSKYILDCNNYNNKRKNVTWETCTLRNWLNNNFLNNAFNATEKNRIFSSYLINQDNIIGQTKGGNNTTDKIFCLSSSEFHKYFQNFFTKWGNRPGGYILPSITKGTFFAKNSISDTGYKLYPDKAYKFGSPYWLRSPGYEQDYAQYVGEDGTAGIVESVGWWVECGFRDEDVDEDDVVYDGYSLGVRPALWVEY